MVKTKKRQDRRAPQKDVKIGRRKKLVSYLSQYGKVLHFGTEYAIGPFMDTLWFTILMKLAPPLVRETLMLIFSVLTRVLSVCVVLIDKPYVSLNAVDGGATIMMKCVTGCVKGLRLSVLAVLELFNSLDSETPLRILSFILTRTVFDSTLSLGYGFSPEYRFLQRRLGRNQTIGLTGCLCAFVSSCLAIVFFHLYLQSSQVNSGPRGVDIPISKAEHMNLFGLSFLAEFIAAAFYYAGMLIALRYKKIMRGTLMLKLCLNYAGVYLVRGFTADTLAGVTETRDPLRSMGPALSSALENGSASVFFANAPIHLVSMVSIDYLLRPVS